MRTEVVELALYVGHDDGGGLRWEAVGDVVGGGQYRTRGKATTLAAAIGDANVQLALAGVAMAPARPEFDPDEYMRRPGVQQAREEMCEQVELDDSDPNRRQARQHIEEN